jgi:hypothetical protein
MSLRLLVATLQITSAAAAYCYSRNGTALLNAAFQPCNNATPESACCMTNHSGAGDAGIADDKCLDNGLCQNFAAYDSSKNNEGEAVWSRQGCTDPLWQSPYCLGDVCNDKKVRRPMLHVDASPMIRHSTKTSGVTWACGIVEEEIGAVDRRPVVRTKAIYSKLRRLWVRHRLFPRRHPLPQPQCCQPRYCQPRRPQYPFPQPRKCQLRRPRYRKTSHQGGLVPAQKPASGPVWP